MIISFVLAEIAAWISYWHFISSPLSIYIPREAGLVLFAAPLIGLIFRRPFSFHIFATMIFFNLSAVLAKSELFRAVLDAVYYFGFEELAKSVYAAFSSYSSDVWNIAVVTWLYVTAESLQGFDDSVKKLKERGVVVENVHVAYVSIIGVSAVIFYIYTSLVKLPLLTQHLFASLAALAALFAASYILARSTGEGINSESER